MTIANTGTARYAGPCAHDRGDCRIQADDDVVFWRDTPDDRWSVSCLEHATTAGLIETTPDTADPTAVSPTETLCSQCFCYHQGDCA